MSLTKLRVHSLISTETLTNTLYNPKKVFHKDPNAYGGNFLKLVDGMEQRKHVLPQDPTLAGNRRQIGFFNGNVFDTAVDRNYWLTQQPEWLKRKVRIYMPDTNHMHNTPVLPHGYRWYVQFERVGLYKLPTMGWSYVNDTQSKRELKFKKLEDALVYCREMGLAYEIIYPHFRYHTKKNYADNYKWKGNPKDKDEDDF